MRHFQKPRAGMVISGSGPNLSSALQAHSGQLVFPIRICSIILPIQVVDFPHPLVSDAGRLRHDTQAAAVSAGSLYSSFLVNMAQICRAILFASAIATSIFGLRTSIRPIQLVAGTL